MASIIARTRRQLSQKETDKDGETIANQISVTIEKNKLAPPFRKAELMIYYGKGFSADNEMFDLAVDFGLIEKAGAWFSYNGEKIGQGTVKAKQWINEHPDIKDLLMNKVQEILMKPANEKAKETNLETDETGAKYDPETGEVFEDLEESKK